MSTETLYYSTYLELDKILNAQHRVSEQQGSPAHDEMLFIIIHQAYELWFKQILFELDYAIKVFSKEKINDNSEDLNLVRHRLNRTIRILELLNQQVEILDTMTPLDFLEFRNLLTPSSGFQSMQFRLIEAKLGLQMEKRHQHDYYKRTNQGGFSKEDFEKITKTEEEKNLLQLINNWLERMPFFKLKFWKDYNFISPEYFSDQPFKNDYRYLYKLNLTKREADKIEAFDYVFFDRSKNDTGTEYKAGLRNSFSSEALWSALFIMLYRDFPVFQTSYQILDALIEIDHELSNWRHKHFTMVRRMIGLRVGTGNTSGAGYLEGALNKHYVYKDLASLSTYLIERKKLPKLPNELIKHLSFNLE